MLIKIGTTSCRAGDTPDIDEVLFDGVLVWDKDGNVLEMVWDDAIQNVRAPTADELQVMTDAKAAADAEAAVDRQNRLDLKNKIIDFRTDMDSIVTSQQVYIDTPATNNVGRDAHLNQIAKDLKQLARDFKQLANVVKGLA